MKRLGRWFPIILGALGVGFAVASGSYSVALLSHLKFEHKLNELEASRLAVNLDFLEQQFALETYHGVGLAEMKDASALVDWTRQHADASKLIVLDASDRVQYAAGKYSDIDLNYLKSLKEGIQIGSALLTNNEQLVLKRALLNGSGNQVGKIFLVSSDREIVRQTNLLWEEASNKLLPLIIMAGTFSFLGILAIVRWLRTSSSARNLTLSCTVWSVAVLLIASVFSARISDASFLPIFHSEVLRKTDTLSQDFARRLESSFLRDAMLMQLPEVDDALRVALKDHKEVAFAAVMNSKGKLLASSGLPAEIELQLRMSTDSLDRRHLDGYSISVAHFDESANKTGSVYTGFDHQYLEEAIRGLTLDTVSIMIVAILVTFEILLLSVGFATAGQTIGSGSLGAAQAGNSIAVRLPVFVFCVSEELSRPFLPAYAKEFASSVPWLSADLAISLPVTLFMLAWAFTQPIGASLSERIGRGRAFFIGAAIAAIGYFFTARVDSLGGLIGWRCITAIGYGLVFIAAHGAVVDRTSLKERASGMAMLVGAILAAGVCGPILGGLLADKIGYRQTYLVSTALVFLSSAIFAFLMSRGSIQPQVDYGHSKSALLDSRARALLRNTQFLRLMLLSAIPTKIAATSILFCLVPLLMTATQSTSSDIGRVQMLYYLAFIFLMPPVAMVADRTQRPIQLVVLGGVLTLIALIPTIYSETSALAIAVAVALFGCSQSMIGSPQLAIVSSAAIAGGTPETVGIAWYRLVERLGGAIGPVLALSIATIWSPIVATLFVGTLCAVSAFSYLLSSGLSSFHVRANEKNTSDS